MIAHGDEILQGAIDVGTQQIAQSANSIVCLLWDLCVWILFFWGGGGVQYCFFPEEKGSNCYLTSDLALLMRLVKKVKYFLRVDVSASSASSLGRDNPRSNADIALTAAMSTSWCNIWIFIYAARFSQRYDWNIPELLSRLPSSSLRLLLQKAKPYIWVSSICVKKGNTVR